MTIKTVPGVVLTVAVAALTMFGLYLSDRPAYHPGGPAPLPGRVEPVGPIQPPAPQPKVDDELAGLQVPLPRSMRVFNRTGSQCVWCTIEMLGAYHKVKGTTGITRQYTWATGPLEVNRVLNRKNVNFRQVVGRDLDFLEEWVTRRKMGCGIGVNGNHCILVCHFERGKEVKVIDNGDPTLSVQTWSWARFMRHFSGWVFVILPDHETGFGGDWNNEVDDGRLYFGKNCENG